MERLKQIIQNFSTLIESGVTLSGDAKFSIAEVYNLRNFIEKLEQEVTELEKVQNYSQASRDFKEPEDREIKGKAPIKRSIIGNQVNHPPHYQASEVNGTSLECIDIMESVKGWYKTALFCELNAFKYNWRLGNKDYIPTELGKIKWYSEKAKSLWGQNLNWFYPKNQHIYAIIEEVRMKDPTTGKWSEGVLYTDGNGTYVRDKVDFMNKFKKA